MFRMFWFEKRHTVRALPKQRWTKMWGMKGCVAGKRGESKARQLETQPYFKALHLFFNHFNPRLCFLVFLLLILEVSRAF